MKKVSELNSTELAYWVAMAQGLDAMIDDGICYIQDKFPKAAHHTYQPQENWSQCGLLIDKFGVVINWHWLDNENREWSASLPIIDTCKWQASVSMDLKTAICRRVVESVYGEFVPSEEVK